LLPGLALGLRCVARPVHEGDKSRLVAHRSAVGQDGTEKKP